MKTLHLAAALLAFVVMALAGDATLSGPGWSLTSGMNVFTFKQAPKLSSAATVDSLTFQTSRLKRIKSPVSHRSAISAVGLPGHNIKNQNITSLGPYSAQYAIDCTWDGVPMSLLFDTGSADTWAVKKGFECEDNSGEVHSQMACGFGKPLLEDFSGETINDVHFKVAYGSGEDASGPMGFSDIACGGMAVSQTQVGLANRTYWHGNNVTNGILGLAYPSLTSAFFGPIGDEAPWNMVTYPPFLTTAISQGVMEPTFSVAMMKNSSDGVLAWGGTPPIGYDEKTNATTDLIIANLIEQDETAWKHSFYTIIPDGIRWGSTTDEAKYPYIVDTGTTMMFLPPPLAESIAQAFEPQAVYLYQWGQYFTDCAAIPPSLAILIEGVEFRINAADLIYRDMIDPMTGYCAIGIASGGSGPYVLGDVFLQNVLAVFDIGGGEMRFYARK